MRTAHLYSIVAQCSCVAQVTPMKKVVCTPTHEDVKSLRIREQFDFWTRLCTPPQAMSEELDAS